MRTRFQGPESSPGLLLWRSTLAWQRDVAAALDPLGLTHSQFVLLACAWWLETHGGAGTQVMIAAQAGWKRRGTSLVSSPLGMHVPGSSVQRQQGERWVTRH